uniref:MARVEL domain-containing protein n=1 Tax=Panagrellus redivivus TaxID=6233 RepID=A0A7E4VPF0_PANRE
MTIKTDLDLSTPFEHYAPEYRCCCGAVHVKQGVQIIGVIQFILAIFSFIALLFASEFDQLWGTLEVASLIIEILVLLCLFYAIKKEKHMLLLPYVVYELIWVLTSIIIALLGVYAFIKPDSSVGHIIRGQLVEVTRLDQFEEEHREQNGEHLQTAMNTSAIQLSALLTTFSFLISLVVSAWWLLVVYKCYIYLKNLAAAREETDFSVRYNSKTDIS